MRKKSKLPAPALEPVLGRPWFHNNDIHQLNHPNEAWKLQIKEIYTCGKRSNGFAFGPPLGGAAGCWAWAGGFTATPLAGPWATGGTSACSGIPWYYNPNTKLTTTILVNKENKTSVSKIHLQPTKVSQKEEMLTLLSVQKCWSHYH